MDLLRRITALFLASIFFILSTSFTFYKTFCEDGCQTEISLINSSDSCCTSKSSDAEDSCHEEEVHEDECCGVEQVVIKFDGDVDSYVPQKIDFSKIWVDVHKPNTFFDETLIYSSKEVRWNRGPPKLSVPGRLVLLRKCVLVI